MDRDSHLIFEALESKFTQSKGIETYAANQLEKMIKELENISTAVHLSKSSHLDQLLSRVRDTVEMLMSERGSGTSEQSEDYANQRKEKFDRAMDNLKDRENERDEMLKDSEEAEGPVTYIELDLYTGKTTVLPHEEFKDAVEGLQKVRGKITVYVGEEYMVLVVPGISGEDAENPATAVSAVTQPVKQPLNPVHDSEHI